MSYFVKVIMLRDDIVPKLQNSNVCAVDWSKYRAINSVKR